MNYLRNSWLPLMIFLTLLGLSIYTCYKDYTTKEIVSPIIQIINKDSIESVIKEQYRLKLDSVARTYNNKIYKLNIENKNLKNEIKNLNSNIGDLLDFK